MGSQIVSNNNKLTSQKSVFIKQIYIYTYKNYFGLVTPVSFT